MKIEFEGIADLREFLEFAGYTRIVDAASALHGESAGPNAHYPNRALWPGDSAQIAGEIPAPGAQLAPEDRAQALAAVREWAEGEVRVSAAPQTEPEPPKRKRRTKAEIEADRVRIQQEVEEKLRAEGRQFVRTGDAPVETPAPSDAQATAATSPLAGANPFDASTSNASAATAALNEAPAGTTGTLSALGSDVRAEAQSAVDGLGAEVDAQTYMQLRVAEMGGTFDPREHMKKCVEFIGALGKAKYDEAFTLAGTSRAVASYTPADCAKHIAALEYLQLSGKGA